MGLVRKTEFLLCHAIASAVCGIKVLFVGSKKDKIERLVKTRIDPSLRSVPLYQKLVSQAAALGKQTDSAKIKQLGDGSIVFLNAHAASSEFTSQPGDSGLVDEFDECPINNLLMLPQRLSGSDEQFLVYVGNPTYKGTEANQNLDYQYKLGDQRQWNVPCDTCKEKQVLEWEANVVKISRNKFGGILDIRPQDETWRRGSPIDMRPLCRFCHMPMDRLHKGSFWEARFPDRRRHSYQLSNIYNPKVRLDTIYDQFLTAKHRPDLLAKFFNNQMGIPYNTEGSSITEDMMATCSSGQVGGAGAIEPYRFYHASQIQWSDAA